MTLTTAVLLLLIPLLAIALFLRQVAVILEGISRQFEEQEQPPLTATDVVELAIQHGLTPDQLATELLRKEMSR